MYSLRKIILLLLILSPTLSQSREIPGLKQLQSLELDEPTSDLKSIDEIIMDSQIVALGESVHTNGSYHKGIARMARYLIEQKGFRVLLLETPWYWSGILQAYTLNCTSNSDSLETQINFAGQTIFPQFASRELRELFVWIRNFNCTNPDDRIYLQGFDIQQVEFVQAMHWLDVDLLEVEANQNFQILKERLDELKKCIPSAEYPNSPNENEFTNCRKFLSDFRSLLTQNSFKNFEIESSIIALWFESERSRLRNALISGELGETQETISSFRKEHYRIRDEGMAKMITHIHSFLNQKTILVGHNGHLLRGGEKLWGGYSNKSAGSYLADYYGEKYKVIASLSYSPQLATWWTGENTYQPGQNSLEEILSQMTTSPAILNLNESSITNGQNIEFNGTLNLSLPASADGILFHPTTVPMTSWN